MGCHLLFNGYRASVWEDEKVLEMDGGDGCKTMSIYLKLFKNGYSGNFMYILSTPPPPPKNEAHL